VPLQGRRPQFSFPDATSWTSTGGTLRSGVREEQVTKVYVPAESRVCAWSPLLTCEGAADELGLVALFVFTVWLGPGMRVRLTGANQRGLRFQGRAVWYEAITHMSADTSTEASWKPLKWEFQHVLWFSLGLACRTIVRMLKVKERTPSSFTQCVGLNRRSRYDLYHRARIEKWILRTEFWFENHEEGLGLLGRVILT
jgi:hypothetical protein